MFRSLEVNGVTKLYLNECCNDLWVREVVFPNRRDGYFIEAGAADGVSSSSCCLLEKHLGWRGICIEPHEGFFAKLVRNRPGSIHENVCLANEGGWVEFVSGGGETGVSPYLSGIRQSLETNKYGGGDVIAGATLVRTPAVKLVDLLRKHSAPPVIEYGAFDIEGSEFEALRAFPFDEYRILAMSFEVDASIRQPLFALLRANGYRESANPFNTEYPWESYWLHESLSAA
ncbi:MAG: FkbM family methyltransferase [Bryobacteraceae bacterium]